MKKKIEILINPFIRIAGMQVLAWGVLGLVISTLLSWASGYHYHGLLHFGPASNPAWWCYLAEHLIIWLIPAILFYAGGLICSHSRIRMIDVFGTVLFAQLPMLVMNLIYILPPMQILAQIDSAMSPREILAMPHFHLAVVLSLIGFPFLVFSIMWMVQALKVSCNLKKSHLWIVAVIGILGGDVLCRILIRLLY